MGLLDRWRHRQTEAPGPTTPLASKAAPVAAAGWRQVGSMVSAVGRMPAVAEPVAFARGLGSRRSPDPVLRPLAHRVDPSAPFGGVRGLARSVDPAPGRAARSIDPHQPAPRTRLPSRPFAPSVARSAERLVADDPVELLAGTDPTEDQDAPPVLGAPAGDAEADDDDDRPSAEAGAAAPTERPITLPVLRAIPDHPTVTTRSVLRAGDDTGGRSAHPEPGPPVLGARERAVGRSAHAEAPTVSRSALSAGDDAGGRSVRAEAGPAVLRAASDTAGRSAPAEGLGATLDAVEAGPTDDDVGPVAPVGPAGPTAVAPDDPLPAPPVSEVPTVGRRVMRRGLGAPVVHRATAGGRSTPAPPSVLRAGDDSRGRSTHAQPTEDVLSAGSDTAGRSAHSEPTEDVPPLEPEVVDGPAPSERRLPGVALPTAPVHRAASRSVPPVERTVTRTSHVLRAAASPGGQTAPEHHSTGAALPVDAPVRRPRPVAPVSTGAVARSTPAASSPSSAPAGLRSRSASAAPVLDLPAPTPPTSTAPEPTRAAVQREEATEATPPSPAAAPPAATGAPGAPLTATTAPAPASGPAATVLTPVLLDEIYERIEQRMRGDLLFDRERKGQLADAR